MAMVVGKNNFTNIWYLDIDATKHLTLLKDWLFTLCAFEAFPLCIYGG
jgi:hypothetical protein